MCLSLEESRQELLGLRSVAGFLGGSSRALKLSLKECLKTADSKVFTITGQFSLVSYNFIENYLSVSRVY